MRYVQQEPNSWVDRAVAYAACSVDALAILGYLAVVDLVVMGTAFPPVVRAVLALPLVVFLPGYALAAVLFPRTTRSFPDDPARDPFAGAVGGTLAPTERAALAFGTSLAVLPLVGIVHSLAGLGYGTSALLGTVNTLVVLSLVVGVVRRVRAPPSERVSFSPRSWPTRVGRLVRGESRAETVLTVAVLVGALVATTSLAFGLVAPTDGESYTTVTLLTENESGSLVMDGYPETLTSDPQSLVVGVENHEGERVDYTIVTELQSVRAADGPGPTTVVDDRELGRTGRTVAAGETWYAERSVAATPELTGERLRLVFLVYRGEAPADPAVGNAYRHVDLSVAVNATG